MKTRKNVAATTQNKIEIIFKIHFSSSSIVFINDIKEFIYFSSTNDDEAVIRREIMKIVYKINLNKTSKVNEIINKTLRQFIQIIIKQIRFFFDRCIKKNIQSSHFKKIFIIMLRKSEKKNYIKLLLYKSIALLNTLNKILKSIVLKRFWYVIEMLNMFLNIQMNARKQWSINTIL